MIITVLHILVSFLNSVAYAAISTPSSVTLKIPYQIPQGNDWCNDRGANLVVHQDVPECGRVCSMVNPTDGAIYRGLFKDKSWSTNVPCSACRQAQWPGCPSFSSKIKKQSSDVLSILAPSPSNAIKVSDNSGINHPKIAETKVQLTNDNQKHKIQSPADKDDVTSASVNASKSTANKNIRGPDKSSKKPLDPTTTETTVDPKSIVSDASTILRFMGQSASQQAGATSGEDDAKVQCINRDNCPEGSPESCINDVWCLCNTVKKNSKKKVDKKSLKFTKTKGGCEGKRKDGSLPGSPQICSWDEQAQTCQMKSNNGCFNKATHRFDAYVPIYWTHHAEDKKKQELATKMQETEKEEAEKKNEEEKTKLLAAATAASAAVAIGGRGGKGGDGESVKPKAKATMERDDSTEVPYIVDIPKASKVRFSSKNVPVERSKTQPNEVKKKDQLRWDQRKAETEARRHEWQRSPYVCPLSVMRMTKYPDEFGAHQGTLESPDAYRRAMKVTIEAAEHVASSTGGNSNKLPTMAYAPDISATLTLENPQSVTYQPIMTHFFSDIDGRSKYAVMGSPGGDIGEFFLAMVAYESASMMTSRSDTGLVYQMLSQFLEDMIKYGKSRFTLVTDEVAVASWTRSAEVTDALHPMGPDGKDRAISTSSLPGSIGSEHLRLMLEHPEEYEGVRPGLLKSIIESFFMIYFDPTHPSQPALMLIVQKGKHKEKGIVIVDRTGMYPEACKELTPLIVPDTGHQSYYVYHRAAAEEHRSAMAEWLMQSQGWLKSSTHPSMGNRLFEDMRRMASKWWESTKSHIARGMPKYRVAFGKE
jgi:hypothetical protein